MMGVLAHRLRQIAGRPPRYIISRVSQEFVQELDRWRAPARAARFGAPQLLAATESGSISELWERSLSLPYPFQSRPVDRTGYDELTGEDSHRILDAAERALAHRIDLLGSGPIQLGERIDWHCDVKTGFRWQPAYFRDIDYARLGEACDVKVPWEISRLQWLIPTGQAYLLTREERYAAACRQILEQWIDANPYAQSVNWACTMEAALRIISWTWLIRACGRSDAWRDEQFREQLLCSLFLHGDFTQRYIERSDVNGNHFTADAAALVFAGLFFGRKGAARRWFELGWSELHQAVDAQVFADGVDFEASIPYHRLVQELFLLTAIYGRCAGVQVSAAYSDRLRAMAQFTAAYSRPDGTAAIWGDNDDARMLPFGGQVLHDHRYLAQVAGSILDDETLLASVKCAPVELFWICGQGAARSAAQSAYRAPRSAAFPDGGFFVMRNDRDHVLVDCGPLGLAGRGGHGHNDLLSFEAALGDVSLIADAGCYVYTASIEERNNFRSTAYHNTPQVDAQEINRFIRPELLWSFHDDARQEVRSWRPGAEQDLLCVSHSGYQRLEEPVTPVRTFILDHERHALEIVDEFEGGGEHDIRIPFHLAEGLRIARADADVFELRNEHATYELRWSSEGAWQVQCSSGHHAPSYGVLRSHEVIEFRHRGPLPAPLKVVLCRARK